MTERLEIAEGCALLTPGFTFCRNGITPAGEPTYEQWKAAGEFLRQCEGAVHWWLGDWLNYGEQAYGEKYKEALEQTGFDYQTLADDKWVAGQFEFSRRRENLPFSHHREVAPLDPDEQDELLDEAEGEDLSRRELRKRVKERHEAKARQAAGDLPSGKFSVVYTDPPWEYGDQRTGGVAAGAASAHYPTLPTDGICSLADSAGRSVQDLVALDAVLFLWATAPCLPDAMRVIEAWGFEYKAQFVWDKVRGFNGHYNDVRHELLLIALRGSFQPKCEELRSSIVVVEKTKHSRKPDVFYEIIEEMYPLGTQTHVEIFSRQNRPGWASWGNEV